MSTKKISEHFLPASSVGTEKRIVSISFGPKKCGKKVYIQAGLHADEPPGYLVASRLLELLEKADNSGDILGEIIVVPAANPVGLSQWNNDTVQGRFDYFDNINFNRQYPDLTEEIAEIITGRLGTEPLENINLIRECTAQILRSMEPAGETEFLKHLLLSLSHDADIVLDLHCDHQALIHVFMGTSLWPEGKDLSAQIRAGATLLASDSGGTPFDEANSKLWWELAEQFPDYPIPPACLAATVELRGSTNTDRQDTEQDTQNLYYFLQRRGYIAGAAPELPELLADATPLEGVDYITSTTTGILTFLKKVGEFVRKGDPIAELIHPMNKPGAGEKVILSAKTDGILFARCLDRFARPGKVVAKIAGKEALEGKGENLLTS